MQPLPIAMQLFQFSLKTSMFCLIPLFIFPCHVLFYISSHASLQCTGKPREFRSKDKRPDLVHIFPFWQFFYSLPSENFMILKRTVDVLSFLHGVSLVWVFLNHVFHKCGITWFVKYDRYKRLCSTFLDDMDWDVLLLYLGTTHAEDFSQFVKRLGSTLVACRELEVGKDLE